MARNDPAIPDGVHALPAREAMTPAARKLRDTYAITPGAPFFHRTFGFWMCLDAWRQQGLPETDLATLFHLDPPGNHGLGQLGWCEAAFCPAFPEKPIRDCGDTEVVQDTAGRHVLFFKGRRQGFMPEYVGHPVRDLKTWEEDVLWRLNPESPARYADLGPRLEAARAAAAQGLMITQGLIGGYMYLRSLIGPEELLLAFYDQPALIHACMRQWLALADAVTARHQQAVTLDEVFLAEDICYNVTALISPDMMREFLIPYYQQLLANIRRRQLDRQRHLYIQVDTDGNAVPVIPLYREGIGMDVMSPFEVASGCDVVAIGRDCPWLAMSGGIDKRVLARSKADIDRMLDRILPAMRARGGYIPTCDHGVPPEVPWQNYLHYRQRCVEIGGE
jgi:uroporphyrinogen decarboxylase